MDKKIKTGLYESIVNKNIEKRMENEEDFEFILDEISEKEDIRFLLKEYSGLVAKIVFETLCRKRNLDRKKMAETINQMLSSFYRTFSSLLESDQQKNFDILGKKIQEKKKQALLLGIIPKTIQRKSINKAALELQRPITPMSENFLLSGAHGGPQFYHEIRREIKSADRIDIIVSFILWSGLVLIYDELEDFTKKREGNLRVITTTYMGATKEKAIKKLAELPNTSLKVSYNGQNERLHAKAYIFHRDTGFSTAYVGSSNLSRSAITEGLEWNMKLSEYKDPKIIQQIKGTFTSFWNDEDFIIYENTEDSEKRLRNALSRERKRSRGSSHGEIQNYISQHFHFDLKPYEYQKRMLEELEAERRVHGRWRNLVVAATGTGKTVISAFDYKRFCNEHQDSANRLLFIAHRKEILQQSLDCFRHVLRNENFGNLWVGQYRPEEKQYDHLFMSIQSFNAKEFHEQISNDFYDFIIIDEFHHAAAPSYQDLLEVLDPKVLVGLTATPERMDGKNVVSYFGDHIACELRLPEAINRNLLCPFHYFAVTDPVDLSELPWGKRGYKTEDLESKYVREESANIRAQTIIEKVDDYASSISEIKGIGFCVSIEHTKFMAEFFTEHGIPSISVSSESEPELRKHAKRKLQDGEVHFVFVVDLYNEGVDIPDVNMVLFLRPTQSLRIYVQQLGRGLRKIHGKDVLTVLDFVGHHNKKFNFRERFRALIGRSKKNIEQEIEDDFPGLPKGCYIQMEEQAQGFILENIKAQTITSRNLANKISSFAQDAKEMELSLGNFLRFHQLEPYHLYSVTYSGKTGWSQLCVKAGVLESFNDPDQKDLGNGLERIQWANSRRWIIYLLNLLIPISQWGKEAVNHFSENSHTYSSEFKRRVEENYGLRKIEDPVNSEIRRQWFLMFCYSIWPQYQLPKREFSEKKEVLQILAKNPVMLEEYIQLLEYNLDSIDFVDKPIDVGFPCALDLHCRYTLDQILVALGKITFEKYVRFSEGVLYMDDKGKEGVDAFFVTLEKSEKYYSPTTMYQDYSISETLFHWQTQSRTSADSETGKRYINEEHPIMLFVRKGRHEYKQMTAPYHYLGKVNYKEHQGSQPINITWELEEPMPSKLYQESQLGTQD